MRSCPARRLALALTLASLTAAAACAEAGTAGGVPSGLGVLKASDAPTLEIGVMEGDPNYSLESVVSVAHTASGELIVGDGGPERVSVFDASGKFLRHLSGRGQGPG